MGVSGGVGGTIKTGTKAAFDLSKGTLLKRFFEKYSGKSSPRKPVTSQKGWTGGFLDDLLERPGFGNFKGGADYMVERSGHLYNEQLRKMLNLRKYRNKFPDFLKNRWEP